MCIYILKNEKIGNYLQISFPPTPTIWCMNLTSVVPYHARKYFTYVRYLHYGGFMKLWRHVPHLQCVLTFVRTVRVYIAYIRCILCWSKLNGSFFFVGRFFRVFDWGQNNCHFDLTVKNTNVPQYFFSRHCLVLTGTIYIISVKVHLSHIYKIFFCIWANAEVYRLPFRDYTVAVTYKRQGWVRIHKKQYRDLDKCNFTFLSRNCAGEHQDGHLLRGRYLKIGRAHV